MKSTSLPMLGAWLALSALACRGTYHDPDPEGPGSDGGPRVYRIQEVQSDTMPAGAAVEVHGAVVTAIDSFGNRIGDFWVQDPDGGPYSGVHVFGAPFSQVADLSPGDVVAIVGAIKSEFAISSDASRRSVTELQAPMGGMLTVVRTGVADVPAPVVVDALAIGRKATQAERDAEWEKWEGVLVTVTNISQLNAAACITSQGVCTDPTFQKFNVTGGLVIESSLSAMPAAGLGPDACLASATGVIDYAFDYLLYARSTSDIALGGTACPTKENTPELCANGIDDDGNGAKDCAENACILPIAACHPPSTISAIQAALPTGAIELQNVYVMALSNDKRSLWVSTGLIAAPNEGVFIFRGSTTGTLDPAVVPGAQVNVIGTVVEFNDDTMGGSLTEVNRMQVTVVADPTDTPVPVTGQDAATLLQAANAPAYESVLVTLDDVKITAIGNNANGFIATAVQGATTFGLGTDILRLAAANLGCYSSITGFWTNLEAGAAAATTKPNAYGFIPVTLGPTGTNCP